jgi:hypothetical protein
VKRRAVLISAIVYSLSVVSGGSYFDIFSTFLIPETTLSYLIPNVCEAIYWALKDPYLKVRTADPMFFEFTIKVFRFRLVLFWFLFVEDMVLVLGKGNIYIMYEASVHRLLPEWRTLQRLPWKY